MAVGRIPHAGPDAELLGRSTLMPDRCGHGKTWDIDCDACAAVWRKDRVKDLTRQAAKYGFRLVPIRS
jgi:hypothetical protein